MTNKSQTSDLKFGRYYLQFSNNLAFTNRTLIIAGFPLILTNLTLDYGRAPGSLLQWFVASLVGFLLMVLASLISRRIFNAYEVPKPLYLPTYVLLGVVRGIGIYLTGLNLGIVSENEITYRLVGSGIYVFCVLPIATILVSNFDRANSTLKALQAQTLRRAKRLNSMKLEIAEQKAEIAGRVSGLLMPVITELMQRVNAAKSSDIGKQISALRNTVDTVVRPLSQSVVQEGNQLSDPQVDLDRASLLARLNPKTKLNIGQLFLPGLSTFLLTLMCSSPILTFGGAQVGWSILGVMAVSTYSVLRIYKRVFRDWQLRAIPAAILEMTAYAAVTGLVVLAIEIMSPQLIEIAAVRLISLNLIFALVFFVAQSRYQLLQQASESLEEVNRELELLNAQAKQELWINRRRIATVLHGPVQAALYASAMRLSQTKRPSKKLLQDVNRDLGEALEALSFKQTELTSIRSVVREIIDVWSGVCEIYFNLPKAIYDITKNSPNVAESFVEIIREATSNAIKHGGATEIEVNARLADGVISLEVLNNGKPPTNKEASSGYGTQILNELALSWSLDNTEAKTLFRAEIVATV